MQADNVFQLDDEFLSPLDTPSRKCKVYSKLGLPLDCVDSMNDVSSSATDACSSSDSGLSTRPTSTEEVRRIGTPPTPISLQSPSYNRDDSILRKELPKSFPIFQSNQDEYLQFMEPFPVCPPSYESLPPGGIPRFPVHDDAPPFEPLPSYSPAAYKISVAVRKLEWLTPYEASPNRSWKHVIIELNSTQLNIYRVPSNSEGQLLSFRPCLRTSDMIKRSLDSNILKNVNSCVTNSTDLQYLDFLQRMNLIDDRGLDTSLDSKPVRSKDRKLLRSYSLQHLKAGLATDCKKKANVLRIRAESEQFLLSFLSVEELIDWNFALGIGKDISLSLDDRELPKYRTVPRRRRRNATANTFVPNRESNGEGNNLKNKLAKLKNKLTSRPIVESSSTRKYTTTSEINGPYADNVNGRTPSVSTRFSNLSNLSVSNLSSNNIEDEDAQEAIDVNHSDEEYDDYDDEFVDRDEQRNDPKHAAPSSFDDGKLELETSAFNQKKYFRNCLRCIKPLCSDDLWVNKSVVIPTTFSLVNSQLMKGFRYSNTSDAFNSITSSTSSLLSLSAQSSGFLDYTGGRSRSYSFKELGVFNLPDASLSRIPNHFVKEYIVGSHTLIPKGIF